MFASDQLYRIALGRNAERCALVDWEDYLYLIQFKWNAKRSHPKGRKETWYARRTVHNKDGGRHPGGQLRKETIYMHVEIMQRQGIAPPTDNHTVDHANCNGLDNRRANLSWRTKKEQRKNRKNCT